MIALRPVDPIGAYNRWDWFRRGLQCAISKTGAHLRPEDAYVRIRNGTAWLYVIAVTGAEPEDIGFIVVTLEHDPDGIVMFIWCMWCEKGRAILHRVELHEELDKLAASVKARRIRWWSPRNGWAAEGYGEPVATIYEREV